jgi:hypothetical protein
MSQHSNSKTKPLQRKDSRHSRSRKKFSHLKLVVSNPAPVQEASPSQSMPSNPGFTAEARKRGVGLYEMNIQDPFHSLECELILDLEKNGNEMTVVCHFPSILNESHRLLDEDETLYGIIMVQFQMKVLEQLFMFCTNHNASRLSIYMDDDQAEGFGVYQDFLTHCDETLTENGEQTEMVISTDQKAFDKWRSFMTKTNLEFEQGLWREQRFNPAIRHYLKSRASN